MNQLCFKIPTLTAKITFTGTNSNRFNVNRQDIIVDMVFEPLQFEIYSVIS